jgi:hypothetical protein
LGVYMLESFKRFCSNPGLPPSYGEVSAWALQQGLSFKRARDEVGFVLDGAFQGKPWRLEWGLPQRAYIQGHELRLRMELKLPSDMQMLVLTRPLMELLERQTFEQSTEGNQTQIDTSTPEEMRWLVMYPKINLSALRNLRGLFGAVASSPDTGLAWLNGVLAQQLERATGSMLRDSPPFVLMTLRGRTYLRMQLADPDPTALATAIGLFETAVVRAMQLVPQQGSATHDSTQDATTAWQSLQPDNPDTLRRR